MKYTHLSIDDTNIWLDNIIKTLELIADYTKQAIEVGKAASAKSADKTDAKDNSQEQTTA